MWRRSTTEIMIESCRKRALSVCRAGPVAKGLAPAMMLCWASGNKFRIQISKPASDAVTNRRRSLDLQHGDRVRSGSGHSGVRPSSGRQRLDRQTRGASVPDFQLQFHHKDPFAISDIAPVAIYRVVTVEGRKLWLETDEETPTRGWVLSDHVMLVDESLPFVRDQIQANPKDPFPFFDTRLGLARCRRAGHRDRRLLRRDSARSQTRRRLPRGGDALGRKNKYDKAIADYTDAIRLGPNERTIYLRRASLWSQKADYDKAIADYTVVIRLDPERADGYYGRGVAFREAKKYERAIADLNHVIKLTAKDCIAYIVRGNTWAARTDFDKAIADYD